MATRGTRFSRAFSHAPTTLSAHASLFTGLDPHLHAVPRNGFRLAEKHETLAEILTARGYDTLAVIGASVLAQKTGILQGFRRFDEELSRDMTRRHEDHAGRVTERALALVDERDTARPLFLWVHYFDPHSPYEAPAHFQSLHVQPGFTPERQLGDGLVRAFSEGSLARADMDHLRALYQAEVHYMDSEIGILLDGLESRGLVEGSLIVANSDHGEAFFEDPAAPIGHGVDIDPWATHVPLLLEGPGIPAGQVIETPIALSDLFNSVLSLLQIPKRPEGGRDLSPLLVGTSIPEKPIFLEATMPAIKPTDLREPGWNNLRTERGVVWNDSLLIASPWRQQAPRIYALPPEKTPIDDSNQMAELAAMLAAWDAQAPAFQTTEMDPETQEALRALGYTQ